MSEQGDEPLQSEARPQPKRGFADIGTRTLSALVLGVFALVVTWLGGFSFRLLSAAMAALILYEWVRMAPKAHGFARWLVPAAGMAVILGALVAGAGSQLVLGLLVVAFLASLVAGWFGARDLSAATGLLYAALAGISLAFLRGADHPGFVAVLFLFAIVWATDILAYFAGRILGGRKLAPSISPGKTWSGAVGGAIGGTLAGIAVAWWAGSAVTVGLVGAVLFLSVFSQIGDLFESAIKRRFGAKDSSHIIPGHGGIMDRVDALVAAAFALYVIGGLLAGFDQPAHAFFRP